MRMMKWVLMAAFLAVGLAACGGSGGGDSSGGGSSDLYEAYNKIAPGQSYEQVRDIVGYAHNNGQQQVQDLTRYDWITDKNTLNVTILYVEIRAGSGVVGKAVGGPKGTFSITY